MRKRVLYIIAQEGFRDEELSIPKKMLEDAGIDVVVASITTSKAKGKLGLEVDPDIAVKDANIDDYDMVVMAGGPGAPSLADHDEVRDIFVSAKENGIPIAAICIAPKNLADFGLLENKKATVFKDDDAIQSLHAGGAIYTGKDVEVADSPPT